GAGGMSEGFLLGGFSLSGANEIEKNYFETFVKNHLHCTDSQNFILGNITDREVKDAIISIARKQTKIGIILGGPPCQGFSHAGWRDPDDERNQLFKDFVEVVNSVKPEAFIMENVPGILTMRNGAALKEIIEAFEGLG